MQLTQYHSAFKGQKAFPTVSVTLMTPQGHSSVQVIVVGYTATHVVAETGRTYKHENGTVRLS
jgi:hypothetical protein